MVIRYFDPKRYDEVLGKMDRLYCEAAQRSKAGKQE